LALGGRASTPFVNVNINILPGMDELHKVKKFLRHWESEFFQEHKRKPSKVGCALHSVRMGHIATGRVACCVCQMCLIASPAKPDEPIEIAFELWNGEGPRHRVLDGNPDPPQKGHF